MRTVDDIDICDEVLGRAGNRMSTAEVDAVVVNLIDRITARMRTAGRTGRTVVLRLRFDDFSRATRSRTLPWATSSTQPILAAARQLVASAAPLIAQRGLTLVGFAATANPHSPPPCWSAATRASKCHTYPTNCASTARGVISHLMQERHTFPAFDYPVVVEPEHLG